MRRAFVLVYGLVAYASFLGVFGVLVLWLGNLGPMRGIDIGPRAAPVTALAIDLALIALFGITHSVLARPTPKAVVQRLTSAAAERATYVLVANATLALLVWQWRPLPDVLWTAPVVVMWVVQGAGIALLVGSTFLTDHLDLFGVRQVWLAWRDLPYAPVPFVERWIYTRLRHPMMLGILLWLWAAPIMTSGRLLFAAGMSAYIAVGIVFEERGLLRALGEPYARYRRRVRALIPIRRKRAS